MDQSWYIKHRVQRCVFAHVSRETQALKRAEITDLHNLVRHSMTIEGHRAMKFDFGGAIANLINLG
jgi:hypothetical protein